MIKTWFCVNYSLQNIFKKKSLFVVWIEFKTIVTIV
jgi:hypothetical protein